MRRLVTVVGIAFLVVGVVSGCTSPSGTLTSTDVPAAVGDSEAPPGALVEQDVVGMSLEAAEAALEDAGWTVTTHDTVGSRSVWVSSNWVVVDQAASDSDIDLGVKKKSDDETSSVAEAEDPPGDEAVEDPVKETVDDPVAEAPVVADPEPELTLGQQNAVGKAYDYLDYSSFSRSGLIDQLKYEGFSTKEATFAVDYVAPNWKKQAAKKAEEYLDYSSFSRQGLIDQLKYEGFSSAEAAYGVKAVGY